LSKIRVVAVVDRIGGGGGGERVAAALVQHLDPLRFDRTLCVTRPSSPSAVAELERAGVRVLELDRAGSFDLRAWHPLLRLLRRENIDVVHSHKFGSNVWVALLARLAHVPVLVTHEHSWDFAGDRLRAWLDRRLIAPRADAMIAVSSADARRMIEIERLPAHKIHVIPNGIATPSVLDRDRLRRELAVEEGTLIVGIVASLRPEKRIDVLIDAVRLLVAPGGALRLVIVGAGPLEGALKAQVASSGLSAVVSFLGYRPDARDLVAGFDVAVLASEREGSPLSLLEYMALERAIVATSVGGIPEMVTDGEHALLVDPHDAHMLAAALERLVDQPAERKRLGAAAAVRQAEEFDLEAVTRRVELLYTELLGRKAG
jgi:glycosyltransferase involved in cell wall biosynthesis